MKITHKTSLSFASSSPSLSTIPKFFSVTLLYQQAPLHSPQPDTQESSFFLRERKFVSQWFRVINLQLV